MKTNYLLLGLMFIISLFSSCNDDNDNEKQNNNEENSEIIEYNGEYPEVVDILIEENGEKYTIKGYSGQVIVYFDTNDDYMTISSIIEELNGKIIEQNPVIQYYLIEVEVGTENEFINQIRKKAIYADINSVLTPRYYAAIIDNFNPDYSGFNHGKEVRGVYEGCNASPTKIDNIEITKENEFNEFSPEGMSSIVDFSLPTVIIGKDYSDNTSISSKEPRLINISYGHLFSYTTGIENWGLASEMTKKTFVRNEQSFIKKMITSLKNIDKKYRRDYVITYAAGNNSMPDYYELVIKPMLTVLPFHGLSFEEQEILKNNILIITAEDSKDPNYSNKSSKHNAMAKVDISNLPFTGTSFAAPQALCYISQVLEMEMPSGYQLTAVEALAAAKEAIKNNSNGEFDVDEAKAIALDKYGKKEPEEPNNPDDGTGFFAGTAFNKKAWKGTSTTTYKQTITYSSSIIEWREDHYEFKGYSEPTTTPNEHSYSNDIEFYFDNDYFLIGELGEILELGGMVRNGIIYQFDGSSFPEKEVQNIKIIDKNSFEVTYKYDYNEETTNYYGTKLMSHTLKEMKWTFKINPDNTISFSGTKTEVYTLDNEIIPLIITERRIYYKDYVSKEYFNCNGSANPSMFNPIFDALK